MKKEAGGILNQGWHIRKSFFDLNKILFHLHNCWHKHKSVLKLIIISFVICINQHCSPKPHQLTSGQMEILWYHYAWQCHHHCHRNHNHQYYVKHVCVLYTPSYFFIFIIRLFYQLYAWITWGGLWSNSGIVFFRK